MPKPLNNQLFTIWSDRLKEETLLSHTKLAERIGYTKSVYMNIRANRTPARKEHFQKMIDAFPEHTKPLVEEYAELHPSRKKTANIEILQDTLNKLLEDNKALQQELKELREGNEEIRKDMQSKSAEQMDMIEKMMRIIERS